MLRAKRILIGLTGGIVLLLGIVMIVLPGPAFLMIPAGLAILATEFEWARRLGRKLKASLKRRTQSSGTPSGQSDSS